MVVDAKIADPINAFARSLCRTKLLDDKRSRLLPPPVAPRRLGRLKRHHHSLWQWCGSLKESTPHRRKHIRARKHVPLHREPVLDQVPGPLHAITTGEPRGAPIRGYGPQLADFAIAIVGKRLFDRRSRIEVEREPIEGALAVPRDDSHRLCRD